MKKIVVTGGRDFRDSATLKSILDFLTPDVLHVGDCPSGADAMARKWAVDKGVTCVEYKAHWDEFGKSAGPIRNREMLLGAGEDAVVVSFPGGNGTANCVKQAGEKNLVVLKVLARS